MTPPQRPGLVIARCIFFAGLLMFIWALAFGYYGSGLDLSNIALWIMFVGSVAIAYTRFWATH